MSESLNINENIIINNKYKIIVSVLVLIGALSYLIFLAFNSATIYYYTVGEANKLDNNIKSERMLRISGTLKPNSFSREEDSTTSYFILTDGQETLNAYHNGIIPDLFFNEHSEIIVEGKYEGSAGFNSSNIIVKCPSKYIAPIKDSTESASIEVFILVIFFL